MAHTPTDTRDDDLVVTLRRGELRDLLAEVVADIIEGQAPKPKLLTREALARELDVSPATVSRLRAEGLPTIYVGDSARFDRDACLAFFVERSQQRRKASGE